MEDNPAMKEALRPLARRQHTTISAVAVAWDLTWPDVSGAIIGVRSPQQIDDWTDAATLRLSPGDLEQIASAIARTKAGIGPARPSFTRLHFQSGQDSQRFTAPNELS
jgi:aryl-alcohol dehydrogenase-like predicted oxidoreductase